MYVFSSQWTFLLRSLKLHRSLVGRVLWNLRRPERLVNWYLYNSIILLFFLNFYAWFFKIISTQFFLLCGNIFLSHQWLLTFIINAFGVLNMNDSSSSWHEHLAAWEAKTPSCIVLGPWWNLISSAAASLSTIPFLSLWWCGGSYPPSYHHGACCESENGLCDQPAPDKWPGFFLNTRNLSENHSSY